MRILNFFINRFGIYEKVQVESLSPEINLFLGDNEAGKSTLLAFFRDILFGFESGRSENSNSYKSQGNASHGGGITLITDGDQKSYRIERSPGKAAGSVTVTMPDGTQQGEESLSILLPRGFTKNVYRNVYGFSLDELQDMNTLKSDDIRGRIYSSAAGAGQVDVMKIDRDIKARMDKLFKPGGSNPSINMLFAKMDSTEKEIDKFSTQSNEYFDKSKRITEFQKQIRDLDEEIRAIDNRLAILGKIMDARDPWEELNRVQSELDNIPMVERFPEKGADRYQSCKDKLNKTQAELDRLFLDIETKRKELSELVVDMRLLSEKASIDEILQGKDQYLSAKRDLPEIKSQEERINAEKEKMINDCGKDWTEAKVMAFDISMPVRDQVSKMKAEIESAERELEALKNRLQSLKSNHDKEKANLDSKEKNLDEIKSTKADEQSIALKENAVRQARHCFRNIDLHKAKKDALTQEVQKLQADKTRDEQSLDKNKLNVIFDFIIGLVLLLIAAYFYKSSSIASIVLGVIGVLILAFGYSSLRDARKKQAEWEYDYALRNSQIEKELTDLETNIQGEWGKLQNYSRILEHELKTVQDVEEADNEIRKLREKNASLNEKEREFNDLLRTFELTKSEFEAALKEQDEKTHVCDAAKEKWVNWLRQNDLPSSYTPDTVRDLFRNIETIRAKRGEANDYHLRVEKMSETIERYEAQIKEILNRCERPIPEQSLLVSALLQLREDLNTSQENWQKRENLEAVLVEKTNDQKIRSNELIRYQQEANELLHAADARDENDFLERAKWYDARQRLTTKKRECDNYIARTAGDLGFDGLCEMLRNEDFDRVEREKRELEEERRKKLVERDAINKDIGKYEQTIADLEKSNELSNEIAKKEALRSELNRMASEWAILAMCKKILKETRDRYEREKQPKVIKSASDMILKMTNGAYKSVFAPLGEQKFELLTPADEHKEIGILSRGTREQLYLAIRFGFIKESKDEPLPVIMDDILVNFDPKRAKAATECILDLSRSHQVLFFTCHPQIKDLFVEMKPEITKFVIDGAKISRN